MQNRLGPQQIARLLDRPEVIKAIGNDTIADARQTIERLELPADAALARALDAPRRRSPRPTRRGRST